MRRKRQFSRIILCPSFCPHTLPDTDIKRLTPPIMTNSERLKFFQIRSNATQAGMDAQNCE